MGQQWANDEQRAQSDLFLNVLVAAAVGADLSFNSVIAAADQHGILLFLLLLLCFLGSRHLSTTFRIEPFSKVRRGKSKDR